MKNIFSRIIRGSGNRPTRFHDERGNLVTPGGYIYILFSLASTISRRLVNYRFPVPWLSYRAQRRIASLLQPDWLILEFGSGWSTAWFAQRCQKVYSFEHDPGWYETVHAKLTEKKISNVFHELREPACYSNLDEFPNATFDFALIDGIRRAECARNVYKKVKPGGWIYLDNTDMSEKTGPGIDCHEAEQILLGFAMNGNGNIKYFTDFVPNNLLAKQGMLLNIGLHPCENF
jgi:hypothetical protein